MAHTKRLLDGMTEAFQLSACPSSVVEHWRLKPEMSWVRFSATASLYFHLNTYKLSLFQREARVLRMALISEFAKMLWGHVPNPFKSYLLV